jgi:hypothetical protein
MNFGKTHRKCDVCNHTLIKGCTCAKPNQNCPVCNNYNFFMQTRSQAVEHIIGCLTTSGVKGKL